jgi:L-seryl-tRNA(Ser) seleniumtransferase
MPPEDPRRTLPSVDNLLREPTCAALIAQHGRESVLREARLVLDALRAELSREPTVDASPGRVLTILNDELVRSSAPSLHHLINATGVVVHTNLGRAPLAAHVAERVAEVATSYCSLEFAVARGGRGDRELHCEERLKRLLDVSGAVVVNNNAAALLLAINTLAEGREVIVSRGELVEIGGSFRIPDVLRKGGARLIEVGTTNRTRLADYQAALTPETALILKVHPSNFRIEGFTESAPLAGLCALAHEQGLPLVEDLGSGHLTCLNPHLNGEATAAQSLAAGVDLLTFSGDKLLGGPQAGIIVGRADFTRALKRNSLYRALRVDKLTLAALDAVLLDYQSGKARERVPVWRMLALSSSELRVRAERLVTSLSGLGSSAQIELIDGESAVGGGAAPTLGIPTTLIAISRQDQGAEALAAALRSGTPPVIARMADERVLLDLRTVKPEEEPLVRDALERVLR